MDVELRCKKGKLQELAPLHLLFNGTMLPVMLHVCDIISSHRCNQGSEPSSKR